MVDNPEDNRDKIDQRLEQLHHTYVDAITGVQVVGGVILVAGAAMVADMATMATGMKDLMTSYIFWTGLVCMAGSFEYLVWGFRFTDYVYQDILKKIPSPSWLTMLTAKVGYGIRKLLHIKYKSHLIK